VSKAAIMSFRKVELLVGAMDLKTDQVGMERVSASGTDACACIVVWGCRLWRKGTAITY
jgi:hypothetical protein